MIVSGATAYSRQFDFKKIREIADEIGAIHMCDMSHYSGLIAGGEYDSPVGHAQIVTSTTHKSIRGPRGGMILCDEQYAKEIDKMVFPGIQGGPLMHVIAGKAVCFKEALDPSFAEYQKQIVANAKRLAKVLADAGFRIVSGGTDNHLMLVDVFSKGITGKVAEAALNSAAITVNKNAIPFDKNPPMTASGIRIGTPAVTSRGMGEAEMDVIGALIARVLASPEDTAAIAAVKVEVEALCRKFPLYPAA
jgi:glycine hydroxymethyltransferase